ncbi:TIGR02679 domain-containing protein [Paenibacillus medicaginis]|uniref:TIGR02679 domain-containing protein n=1 Tax=Paenibacillus medicaginis TaxID=1470560 RepID=A0ABV5C7W8_9BACL
MSSEQMGQFHDDSSSDNRLEQADRARVYFSRPGFSMMLEAIWKRYASLEKAAGHAVIRNATSEECDVINSFMGWFKQPGTDIRVPLQEFEQELMSSPFPFSIPELHTVLVGTPLLTNSDRKLLAEQDWLLLFYNMEQQHERQGGQLPVVLKEWLTGLQNGTAEGYRTLRDMWRTQAEAAERELLITVRAWSLLLSLQRDDQQLQVSVNSAVRLPVLAAQVAGNPHALDRNMPAGRLLVQALLFAGKGSRAHVEQETEEESGSEILFGIDSLSIRDMYRKAGILDDDISSLVHVYYPWDRGAAGPQVMTLRQVDVAKQLRPVNDIYVVENPAVFSTLVDLTETEVAGSGATASDCGQGPLLLCTSGPASAAALRLLDRYVEEDWQGTIYYSGDFDIKGVQMGNVLAARYAAFFAPWHFNGESYKKCNCKINQEGVMFTNEERAALIKMQPAWDKELCFWMADTGRKLFQEEFINELIRDWSDDVEAR